MTSNDFTFADAKSVIDSLADGVYVTDLNRKIVVWNDAAHRLTGWSAEEIIGRTCYDDVLCHEDIDGRPLCGKDICPLHRAIASGEPSRLPEIVFAKGRDGTRIPVEVSVAPLRDEAGTIVGGVESFRDLSPLLDELKYARIIQEHAMHSHLPDDQRVSFALHSVPAEYVSGDFHRVEARDGSYVMVLADVMGHGITAALFTMQLRSLWEEARDLLMAPEVFAAHINEKLHALTAEDDFFATAFVAVYNVESRMLRYVDAGHPPPLVLRGEGSEDLELTGPAVGLMPAASFETREVVLTPGETVLLFSDGAVEARNPAGIELQRGGLVALARDIPGGLDAAGLAALEERLLSYTERPTLEDDLTLISLTVS